MSGVILVVEDDPDLRDLLQTLLSTKGFEVDAAANGQEALDAMDRRRPGLILLDMKMPVMDGWQFCRALEGRGARPPILVLTAAYSPAQSAAEVQAQGWLGKPFDVDELESKVRSLVA